MGGYHSKCRDTGHSELDPAFSPPMPVHHLPLELGIGAPVRKLAAMVDVGRVTKRL